MIINTILFKECNTNDPQSHEIKLTVAIHQRNANKSHGEIPLTAVRMAMNQKYNKKYWQGSEERAT